MKHILIILFTLVLLTGLACNLLSASSGEEAGLSEAKDKTAEPTEEITQKEPTITSNPVIQPPGQPTAQVVEGNLDASPPTKTIKLIFIHHSSGENWLADENGGLALTLRDNYYFVSDTNYGWGPDNIGDLTDIGHWWSWFAGPHRDLYMEALFKESDQNASYSRLENDPGGENLIVMFKSCFPNSGLNGDPNENPPTSDNPLRGQDSGSEYHTIANAKGIYNDLLNYFKTRPDKLFIIITAPPLGEFATAPEQAAIARLFNRWLVEEWLSGYSLQNVAVFDYFNVLTSNGGDPDSNDAGVESGNHHRFWNGVIQYIAEQGSDHSAYAANDDSHPTAAGNQKATIEFIALLNIYYHRWLVSQ
jgi:hypothetical protein